MQYLAIKYNVTSIGIAMYKKFTLGMTSPKKLHSLCDNTYKLQCIGLSSKKVEYIGPCTLWVIKSPSVWVVKSNVAVSAVMVGEYKNERQTSTP